MPSRFRRRVGLLNDLIGHGTGFVPPADAGGDGLLGGRLLLADALWRGPDGVHDLERPYLLGEFGSARPFRVVWLMSRRGKTGLELVTQAGQFGKIRIMQEGFAETGL